MSASSARRFLYEFAGAVRHRARNGDNLKGEGRAVRLLFAIALCALLGSPLYAQYRSQYRSGYPANSRPVRIAPSHPTNLPPGTGFNGILGSRNPGAGLNGLPTLQNRPYRSKNCFNCGSHRGNRDHRGGYGYAFGSYGYPFVGSVPLFDTYEFDSGQYPPSDEPIQRSQPDAAAIVLGNEVSRLKTEVDRLKDQQNTLPVQQDNQEIPADQPAEPATVIVLRDGHTVESTNYAIMNQTLWNFTARPVQKIPLSSIDLSASARANAERGVDFSVIGGGVD
jgi:hypothetical protein